MRKENWVTATMQVKRRERPVKRKKKGISARGKGTIITTNQEKAPMSPDGKVRGYQGRPPFLWETRVSFHFLEKEKSHKKNGKRILNFPGIYHPPPGGRNLCTRREKGRNFRRKESNSSSTISTIPGLKKKSCRATTSTCTRGGERKVVFPWATG